MRYSKFYGRFPKTPDSVANYCILFIEDLQKKKCSQSLVSTIKATSFYVDLNIEENVIRKSAKIRRKKEELIVRTCICGCLCLCLCLCSVVFQLKSLSTQIRY